MEEENVKGKNTIGELAKSVVTKSPHTRGVVLNNLPEEEKG